MSTSNQPSRIRRSLASQTQQLRRNLQTPIPAPRIALERKISLRFPHFQGFLTEYCSNVSITGMFIESGKPRPPGEILDFEFNLIDGLKLIRGTGEVVWVRKNDEGPQLPAGMGIRFLRLDAESRRLIRWAVEKQISSGGQPFDLDAVSAEDFEGSEISDEEEIPRTAEVRPDAPIARAPTGSPRAQGVTSETSGVAAHQRHPYAGYAVARKADWRSRVLAGVTVTLPIAILTAAILMSPKSQSPAYADGSGQVAESSSPENRASAAADEVEREGSAEASETPLVSPEAAESAEAPSPREELMVAVQAWAQAWAEQRPEDYLGHYSESFRPPRSMTRAAWEAERSQRISRPDFIRVDVTALDAELQSNDRASVTFDQAYRSDNFRDTMRKTLELVREDGAWKILEERAAG